MSNRADLGGHRERKRKELSEQPPNWRDSSKIWDPDATFKALTSLKKSKSNEVKQASLGSSITQLPSSVTQQQITDRIKRMNIIQEDVKNGTYNDPDKPYNKSSRWIEDGE